MSSSCKTAAQFSKQLHQLILNSIQLKKCTFIYNADVGRQNFQCVRHFTSCCLGSSDEFHNLEKCEYIQRITLRTVTFQATSREVEIFNSSVCIFLCTHNFSVYEPILIIPPALEQVQLQGVPFQSYWYLTSELKDATRNSSKANRRCVAGEL